MPLAMNIDCEAWRATEHVSVASIRSNEGWLDVLKTLDKHYKYLPETELHEAIDEFLFLLRRRGGEVPQPLPADSRHSSIVLRR